MLRRIELLLFLAVAPTAAFSGPAGYTAQNQAVSGTGSDGKVADTCAFLTAGEEPSKVKYEDTELEDDCTKKGLPAGICFACDGNPSNPSKTCRDAIERYRELGFSTN